VELQLTQLAVPAAFARQARTRLLLAQQRSTPSARPAQLVLVSMSQHLVLERRTQCALPAQLAHPRNISQPPVEREPRSVLWVQRRLQSPTSVLS
jgi:hypothetical protein